jgi:hypothetical protein
MRRRVGSIVAIVASRSGHGFRRFGSGLVPDAHLIQLAIVGATSTPSQEFPEVGSGAYPRRYRVLICRVRRAVGSVTSNKSLERTVTHRGRTVRAFAVGARAGAEQLRHAAVQRNR